MRWLLPQELQDTQFRAELNAANQYMAASPEERQKILDVTGMSDAQLRSMTTQAAPVPAPRGGLYDQPVGALDPRAMMLMHMGMGLMRGPSTTPISFGQSLGQAGMQGLQAYQVAQKAAQEQQLTNLKLAEVKRQEEERAKREAAQADILNNPQFAQFAPLIRAGLPLTSVVDHVIPKPKAPENPFAKVDPKDYTPESVAKFKVSGNYGDLVAAAKPEKVQESELTRAIRERDALPPNHPHRPLYDAKIAKLTTHAPAASAKVEVKQESEFGKAVGKELGDMYSSLLRADMNAPATIAKYDRLGSLLGQVQTGKFKGTTVELKAAAKSLGIDLNALGVKDDVAPSQAATALANQLALEMRNPAGGAGMPGAMSDKDREFLVQMIPSLENDPQAIGQMVDYRKRLAKRDQQVAKLAREYRQKNGKFDEGFFDQLQSWSEKNPLFPEAGRPLPKLSDKAQKYLDQAGAK